MVKLLVLGLLLSTQAAMAGYRCTYDEGESLLIKELDPDTIEVALHNNATKMNFDGKLDHQSSQIQGLYKTLEYDLEDTHQAPGHLTVSITPRFGRGCGRACLKGMGTLISAKVTFAKKVYLYDCISTID